MAYTVPPTKTPPTPTLAADWNTYIRDNEITLRANALSGMGELIQTQTIAAAASVTFSSLTTDYTHLGFVVYGLYADVNDSELLIQMNADTGNNYSYAYKGHTTGDADSSAGDASNSDIAIVNFVKNSTTATAVLRGYVYNYRSTSVHKTLVATGGNSSVVVNLTGLWKSTSAITSVKFYFGGNNGTGTFCMYGLND
jgi:hypothetical protein